MEKVVSHKQNKRLREYGREEVSLTSYRKRMKERWGKNVCVHKIQVLGVFSYSDWKGERERCVYLCLAWILTRERQHDFWSRCKLGLFMPLLLPAFMQAWYLLGRQRVCLRHAIPFPSFPTLPPNKWTWKRHATFSGFKKAACWLCLTVYPRHT